MVSMDDVRRVEWWNQSIEQVVYAFCTEHDKDTYTISYTLDGVARQVQASKKDFRISNTQVPEGYRKTHCSRDAWIEGMMYDRCVNISYVNGDLC